MTPMIVFMVVDLPAPLAPMSVTIFPSGTERLTPVSYTHLDVYKRQRQECVKNLV